MDLSASVGPAARAVAPAAPVDLVGLVDPVAHPADPAAVLAVDRVAAVDPVALAVDPSDLAVDAAGEGCNT